MNDLQPQQDLLPWHWVFNRAYAEVVKPIERDWLALLSRPGVTEPELLGYLAAHPYFFFVKSYHTQFVLKELRLGGDFTIDFVVPTDGSSFGMSYELVEVERPDTPPFTERGNPSARLSHAIQQVVDWKTWLNNHPNSMHELFPAPGQVGPGYELAFSFSIVIGTRENTAGHLKRRNALARTTGISIRTFDSLTDNIRTVPPPRPGTLVPSAEAQAISYEIAARLKNPFYVAWGDAEWRNLRARLRPALHFVERNAAQLAEARRFHEVALSRFRNFCEGQPPEDLAAEIERDRETYRESCAGNFDLLDLE